MKGARLYGALDLLFAALYGWVGFVLVPGRSLSFDLALGAVIAVLALAGAGLLGGFRWARPLALLACGLLLAFAAVVVILLVASSAYLAGVYGALGRGMSILALVVAALVFEGFAFLPLLELKFLLGARRA